jgi:hypothetical protein
MSLLYVNGFGSNASIFVQTEKKQNSGGLSPPALLAT